MKMKRTENAGQTKGGKREKRTETCQRNNKQFAQVCTTLTDTFHTQHTQHKHNDKCTLEREQSAANCKLQQSKNSAASPPKMQMSEDIDTPQHSHGERWEFLGGFWGLYGAIYVCTRRRETLPRHLRPLCVMPCKRDPQWSQNIGDRKVTFCHLWGIWCACPISNWKRKLMEN